MQEKKDLEGSEKKQKSDMQYHEESLQGNCSMCVSVCVLTYMML